MKLINCVMKVGYLHDCGKIKFLSFQNSDIPHSEHNYFKPRKYTTKLEVIGNIKIQNSDIAGLEAINKLFGTENIIEVLTIDLNNKGADYYNNFS